MGRSQLARTTLFLALSLAPAFAWADRAYAQNAEDKAAADAAFDQGKRLMAAHSYAEACQKFSESLRRDPGIGTMLGLADCYEKNGQTASAWAQFREAAAVAVRKTDAREKVAREQAQRLEPLLSRLSIHVPHESDARGLIVKRDGVDVGRALWDTEVPLDPGVHTITASAPGMKDWQASITIAAQPGAQSMNVPALEVAPIVAAPAPGAPAAEGPAAPPEDPGRTQKYVAVGVAGVGVVGVVVGTIFGLNAKSKLDQSNADNHCDPSGGCDSIGLPIRNDARSAANVSTVAFIVGGVAIAGGAVLWFTAPKAKSGTPSVGFAPAPGGASFVGVF